jgi:cysteinyl-tRNA synthetase
VTQADEGGRADAAALEQFLSHINDDLNMPRALAVAWEVVRGDLPLPVKRATLLDFDRVFGLRLAEWRPAEVVVPAEVLGLVEQRNVARREKRWADADRLRQEIAAAGFELRDTPQGAEIKPTTLAGGS